MTHAKRLFLLALVGTIALAAVFGIWVILFESFLGIDSEIFATLGTIFLFALPGLLAASMLERKHWVLVNRAALVVGAVGTVLFLVAVWFEPRRWLGSDDEWLYKPMLIAAIWAWALPWAAALGMTRFEAAGLKAMRLLSMAVTCAFASLLTLLVIWIDSGIGNEIFGRLVSVFGILTALGTFATPILHVVFGAPPAGAIESTPLELTIRCPRCLLEQSVTAGKSRCRACKLRLTIEIEEPRCPKCRYLLHQLTSPTCPECGEPLGGEEVAAPGSAPAPAPGSAPAPGTGTA